MGRVLLAQWLDGDPGSVGSGSSVGVAPAPAWRWPCAPAGLITQTNVTVTAIAASVGLVSHDGLSRLWPALGRSRCRLPRVPGRARGSGASRATALWRSHDELIPKPVAHLIAFGGRDYDHCMQRYVFGQRPVVVSGQWSVVSDQWSVENIWLSTVHCPRSTQRSCPLFTVHGPLKEAVHCSLSTVHSKKPQNPIFP